MFTISVGPTCTGWILGGLTLSWSLLRKILSFGICVFVWIINRRFGAVCCSHIPPRRWRQQILSKSEWIPTGRRGVQSQNSVFFRWELLATFPDLVCCNQSSYCGWRALYSCVNVKCYFLLTYVLAGNVHVVLDSAKTTNLIIVNLLCETRPIWKRLYRRINPKKLVI